MAEDLSVIVKSGDFSASVCAQAEELLEAHQVNSYLLFSLGRTTIPTAVHPKVLSNWPHSALNDALAVIINNLKYRYPRPEEIENAEVFSFSLDLMKGFDYPGGRDVVRLLKSYRLASGEGIFLPVRNAVSDAVIGLFSKHDLSETINAEFISGGKSLLKQFAEFLAQVKEDQPRLSKREIECLRWIAEGKTSYEIALILGLSESTINNYLATVAYKLGAVNRTHAVSIALRAGYV